MFDTYESCYGCPYRCSGSNPRCPERYHCLGCHGQCGGYQFRYDNRKHENELSRLSSPLVSGVEYQKRVNSKVVREYKKNQIKKLGEAIREGGTNV